MKNIGLVVFVAMIGMSNYAFAGNKVAEDKKTAEINLSAIAAKVAAASAVEAAKSANEAAASANAAASSVAQAGTVAATPKDNDDWTGDNLQIKGNLHRLKKVCNSQDTKAECDNTVDYFAPAYLRFDVSADDNENVKITPRTNFKVEVKKDEKKVIVRPASEQGLYGFFSYWGPDVTIELPQNVSIVEPYETYIIKKREIEDVPYERYGWTYGALLVPFKYHPNYKALSFSNSFQVYLGYKKDTNGLAQGPFISAGLATADVPTAAGQSNTKQGMSYGAGWIFDVKKNSGFQLTIMAGQDVFGATAGYPYEGDTWYSVSLGYNLDAQTSK